MKLLYVLSALRNSLYDGRFQLNGRYRTYGQHSFIYDFLTACKDLDVHVELSVRGRDRFPLSVPLTQICTVSEYDTVEIRRGEWDAVIVDEIDDDMLNDIPRGLLFCMVHNARRIYPSEYRRRCDMFLCMSASSFRRQSTYIDASKLQLLYQGIDLNRFPMKSLDHSNSTAIPRVLVSSRLDGLKLSTITEVIFRLAESPALLTVVGDGDAFWQISDRLGQNITLINFIPCHSVQHFLPQFDIVVSSGRGVMESLATGIPSICAGLGYGGLVTPNRVEKLREATLTGYGCGPVPKDLTADLRAAQALSRHDCRQMAECFFDIDSLVQGVIQLVQTKSSHMG